MRTGLHDPLGALPSDDAGTLAAATAEAEAALALGRLDGMLGGSRPAAQRIFAGTVVRTVLVSALAQEGHAFTDQRFDAWFAGLLPLVDASERTPTRASVRSPRILAALLLTELGYSSWTPLADAANALRPALLAFRDPADGDGDTRACIADARSLVAALGGSTAPLPFASLRRLHAAIAASTRFAPAERSAETIAIGPIRFAVERAPPPSPRWAIEFVYGEHLHATGLLGAALPCPGLVRLDALDDAYGDGDDPGAARIIRAHALRDLALELVIKLRRASESAARIAERLAGLRRSSRGPALAELLAGFGALRSGQIEVALGVSRLGVRGMLTSLYEARLATRTALSGSWLTSIANLDPAPVLSIVAIPSLAFSQEAVAAYDAANANIDRLLARTGVKLDPDEI